MEETKRSTLCQSELLARGWTKKTIEVLLPRPKEAVNPWYKSAPPMLLWDVDVVEQMEKCEEFLVAKKKKEERSAAQQKAVLTKQGQLLATIEGLPISVRRLEESVLKKKALASRGNWYSQNEIYESVHDADAETIQRWIVNYIRHNLTKYDSHCILLFGKVGRAEGYRLLRSKVLRAIADAYPYLSEECERQANGRQWERFERFEITEKVELGEQKEGPLQ